MTDTVYGHIPVLLDEVVDAFAGLGLTQVVDGTLGLGGHTEALLKKDSRIRVLGLDWDAKALQIAQQRMAPYGDRFEGVQASYADLADVLQEKNRGPVDGLLLDLGLSTLQLDDAERGFSFLSDGPLDMRMSDTLPRTAWQILQQESDESLAKIFWLYGEERFSRRAARALKDRLAARTLVNSAKAVADCLREAMPYRDRHIDPATRCFQALRIAVNGELDNVKKILSDLPKVLRRGARVAIIAFHSLEDRLVKHAFTRAVRGCVCPPAFPVCTCGILPWGKKVTRKPIRASESEMQRNPRSRSAILRVLEIV